MKILLSIKPEYAEKILDGTKKYEFRKRINKNSNVKVVVLYVTQPVGRIVGEFDISEVVCDTPEQLWIRTKEFSGITKDFFETYFAERVKAFAFAIGDVRRYDAPIKPHDIIEDFTPPQSYMYVTDDLKREVSQPQVSFNF